MKRLRRYSLGTLVINIIVILWGAYVRATGSGAGCGNHWPLCNGEFIPQSALSSTLIEFTHRVSSGLAFLMVVILYILVRRAYPVKSPIRQYAAAALVLMIIEALIGAALVIFELVAYNTSVARAAIGAFHLLNTFLLLGSIVAVYESLEPSHARSFGSFRSTNGFLILGTVGFLLVGMSGAITALGDTLFPSSSLLTGIQEELSSDAHFLIRLRVWHPLIALLASIFTWVGVRGSESTGKEFRIQAVLLVLIVVQLLAGLINVLLLAPIWLQIVHLLLADLIWVVLITYIYRSTAPLAALQPT